MGYFNDDENSNNGDWEIANIADIAREYDSQRRAARSLDIPHSTLWDMIQRNDKVYIKRHPLTSEILKLRTSLNTVADPQEVRRRTASRIMQGNNEEEQALAGQLEAEKKKSDDLALKCQSLSSELNKAKKERLITEEVRKYILDLTAQPINPASWLTSVPGNRPLRSSFVGVPTLAISDVHLGETVHASQVFGKNEYNVAIGKQRLREVGNRTIDVLTNHMVAPDGYPGIVVDLAGDLISGDIHEELSATNDKPIMPCVLELVNELAAMLQKFAGIFRKVMVFSVPGNHGRNTRKIHHKNLSYTNFDWLISCLLEKFFLDDKRVQFYVSDQADLQYKIYEHRFRLTHGFQFRGGQGFVGPYAPIARGDKKKRSSAVSYGMEYDTMVMGHFHQLWMPGQVIVNGSVVGFNEFAMNNNFDYEVPKQALWITNPTYGITYTMPIFCEEPGVEKQTESTQWVQWYKG